MNSKEEISKKEKQDRNTVVMCVAVSMVIIISLSLIHI